MKPIVILSVGILFVLSLVFGVEAQTPEPLPTRSNLYPPWYVFPANPLCEEVGAVSEGPTWGEITIGISKLEDLKAYANKLNVYDQVQEWTDFIRFESSKASDEGNQYPTINACVDTATQTITALHASTTPVMYLEDLVAAYGVPDAVTWGHTNIDRSVFWFEEGVAALVSIYQTNATAYGEVIYIVYFPYQSTEGFEERYPYDFTSKENPININATDDPLLSEAQNPFDFEAMIATITAQPSQTPEPLPTRSKNYAPFYVFPANLYCEEIGTVSEGPTWGEITVGVSTLEDLKAYANKVGAYDWIQEAADFIIFANKVTTDDGPPTINACVDTNTQTVTALVVSTTTTVYLEDLVAQYGIPDAVTWGLTNIDRTVFWFEEGIAALVSIYETNATAYREVIFITYFPYQSSEAFEEGYPYDFTAKENPIEIAATYDPPLSEDQNPFDFEAMMATITAQPSQTPEPLPTRAKFYPPWDVFPGNLYCEEIGPVSEGPTWGEITVGVSTRDDLKAYADKVGVYDWIQEWDDYIIFTNKVSTEDGLPTINACFDPTTQIITALRVGTHSPVYLDDLVAQYGIPDTVTWGPSNVSRTVFWFEEGVAAYVGIHATDRQAYGEIGYIIYLPYQSKAGFE